MNAKDVYIRPKIGPSDTEDVYIRPLTSILFLFSVVQGFYPWLFQRTWEQFENPLTTEFCTVAQHNTQKALFMKNPIWPLVARHAPGLAFKGLKKKGTPQQ